MFAFNFWSRFCLGNRSPRDVVIPLAAEGNTETAHEPLSSSISSPDVPSSRLRLILDVDGTLISLCNPTMDLRNASVYLRPGVEELFHWAYANGVRVSIFTAASPGWFCFIQSKLLSRAMPLGFHFEFVYTDKHCHYDPIACANVKRLERVWNEHTDWNETNTLIVDDTPSTFTQNLRNALLVNGFRGDDNDVTLFRLIDLLDELKDAPDCRHADFCRFV